MGPIPFDAFDGAICAYVAAKRKGFVEPAFDHAIIDIQTAGAVDEYAVASAISAVARQCRRLYALIKYGSPRKHLTKSERRDCKPAIARGERSIRFDFRPLLGRLWNMAVTWTGPQQQESLLEPMIELFKDKTTRLGEAATRELLKHLVNKTAFVVATIGVASAICLAAVEWRKDDNQTQLALARIHIEGGKTAIEKSSRRTAAAQIETQISHAANIITEVARDDPVLTFVSAQVDQFRPALFEVIASSGGGLINAVEFKPVGAANVAKRAKQNAKKGIGAWTTTVSIMS
ncbi:MAG: hypothetical protein ACKVP4_13225 [Hyphomicrobium sp.]